MIVETVVAHAVVVVGAAGKIVAVELIGPLDKTSPSTFRHKAAAVATLYGDAAAAIKAVMDIHAATGVVDIADVAVGAASDRATAGCDRMASGRRYVAGRGPANRWRAAPRSARSARSICHSPCAAGGV